MEHPRNKAELDALVATHDGLVVLVSENACHVGAAIEPKVTALLATEFPRLPLIVLTLDAHRELAAQLGVFAVPTVLAYFGGRESARLSRHFSIDDVAEAVARPYALIFG